MSGYRFVRWKVDAPLTGTAVDRSGRYAAFSGGDGAVRIVSLVSTGTPHLSTWRLTTGAVLTLAADCGQDAFLCGTDDGAVFRIHVDDGPVQLAVLEREWPDQLMTHPCGVRAIADGPMVQLVDGQGRSSGVLGPHPSTVAGMAFDDTGRRLAISHYNGVTIWQLDGPRCVHNLFHRGSHLQLCWRRDGRYVVTATQDKTVHAWDLLTEESASLGQCFTKVRALGWSADGEWLLASGNDTVSAWPFPASADGVRKLPAPAPQMLGRFSEQLVSQVSPHPTLALSAAGYNDGGLEVVGLVAGRPARHALAESPGEPVGSLAWSPCGDHLIGGDQDREVFVCRFDSRWLSDLLTEP